MVWIKDILKSLIQELNDEITVKDREGDDKEVNVHLSNLSDEDMDELLPLITIRLYDIVPDFERVGMYHGVKKREENEDEDTVTLTKYPEPYWLFVEINVNTEFLEDAHDIFTQIFKKYRFRTDILVPEDDGEEVALFMNLVQFNRPSENEQMAREDYENRKRRYYADFRYKITAELPYDYEEVVEIVKERTFEVIEVDETEIDVKLEEEG